MRIANYAEGFMEAMDEATIVQYIQNTFAGVEVATVSGGSFFMYDPDRTLPLERKFPFATIVTSDEYDSFSNLSRTGVFRLNIGVSRETFRTMFPPPADTAEFDFTALDRWLPHPVYGKMYWVSVLNPNAETFEQARALLTEAYEIALSKYRKNSKDS
jgi:hypothetical protein